MSAATNGAVAISKELFYQKLATYYDQRPHKKPFTKDKISSIIHEMMVAKQKRGQKERREYFLLTTCGILSVGNNNYLIKKHTDQNIIEYVVAYEDLFDRLYDYHVNKTGHGGRVKMECALREKYNIPRPAVEKFVECCRTCNEKKQGKKKVIVRPIVSKDFNERGQIDLIDLQSMPDGRYKWILNYQDHSTKFLFLCPLQSKRAEEVANQLLNIFLLFGAPKILQSDNGREFVNNVIQELKSLWPECIMVHGRPRHPQSQGSVERANQDIEHMLRAWMSNHHTKQWSVGLNFVQWQKNISFHRTIGRSPYKALLGCDPKVGVSSSSIRFTVLKTLTTEEELEQLLQNSLQDENQSENRSQEHEDINKNQEPMPVNVVGERNRGQEEDSTDKNCDMIEENEEDIVSTDHILTPNKLQENTTQELKVCIVCEKHIDIAQNKCPKCSTFVHKNCVASKDNDQHLCNMCLSNNRILKERCDATQRMQTAAKKMLSYARERTPSLKIGDNVLLTVPKVDRGPTDPPNILCIIIDQPNGVNQLGCGAGIIKGWFGAESLITAGATFLSIDKVQQKQIPIREAVALISGGQEFLKCSCRAGRKQCSTAKCICRRNKLLCNSRCHQSLNCVNKKICCKNI